MIASKGKVADVSVTKAEVLKSTSYVPACVTTKFVEPVAWVIALPTNT